MKVKNNKSGFTLIEVIVILAVLSVIAAIAIPSVTSVVNNAKIASDKASAAMLNSATKLYSVFSNSGGAADIFDGLTTDDARMQKLIDSGFLNNDIEALYKDSSFKWDVANQSWEYEYTEDTSSNTSYDFKTISLNSFTKTGSWSLTSDGVYTSNGILFIPNTSSQYILTVNAEIGDTSDSGFGILFDTSLSGTNDTGYVLKFDKSIGNGSVVIIPRTNGVNGSYYPGYVFNSDNSVIPSKSTTEGSTWWSQQHEVKLSVSSAEGDTNTKKLTVHVDGLKLFENFTYTSTTTSSNNYVGLSASGLNGSTFSLLSIS